MLLLLLLLLLLLGKGRGGQLTPGCWCGGWAKAAAVAGAAAQELVKIDAIADAIAAAAREGGKEEKGGGGGGGGGKWSLSATVRIWWCGW